MKKVMAIALFLGALCGGLLVHNLYYRTDALSLRYNLWKIGLWPVPNDLVSSLNADAHGAYLKGKTKDEIKALFPGAHERPSHLGGRLYEVERSYDRDIIRGKEHLWLDTYDTVAFFKDGRFDYLLIMAG
jgi:hypothetical protein